MKITVKIFEQNEEILSKVFDEGVYRLGRSDFADVVLSHEGISRSHMEIRVSEGSVYLTNMSSGGKVKVNGKSVEAAEINDGDEVTAGPYRIVILHGEVGEPLAPEVAPAAEVVDGAEALNPNEIELPNEDAGEIVQAGGDRFEIGGEEPAAPAAAFETEGTAALNRAETVVEMKPVVAKLLFSDGPRKGQELMLETYEVSFGRSKKADIFLDDEKLSRVHAKITRVGMGFRLIDLNSRNGTYVNGVRVLEHPLSSFDTIEIGHSKIKFLIHDVMSSEVAKGPVALEAIQGGKTAAKLMDATKSIQLQPDPNAAIPELQVPGIGGPIPPSAPPSSGPVPFYKADGEKRKKLIRVAIIAGIVLLGIMLVLPNEPKKATQPDVTATAPTTAPTPTGPQPPMMSKEYLELSPQTQKAVEGHYTTALRAADREMWEEAVSNLKKIHEVLPYYKQSKDLLEQYSKRLKEKQIRMAEEKAKRDEKQELTILLQEGVDYLRDGEFDRASDAFQAALNLDPNNKTAAKGVKAANYRLRNLEQVPEDRDLEEEKNKKVKDLFQKAVAAFASKSYQSAIEAAEEIRKIELKGDTSYLNSAKQIIDRAKMLQKEEFEPFLLRAKENYQEGDYTQSRSLCEEMLKKDPAYDEAKECVLRAKKQLNRLAKEAYTHGYVLESLNRLEEAKQYWNRAKNYVSPGDEYYDKVMKKLEQYQ